MVSGKNKVSQRITQKASLKRVLIVAASSVMLITIAAWFLFVYLNLGNTKDAKAQNQNYSSRATGFWVAATSWNGGNTPPVTGINKDNIIINSGHVITRNGSLDINNQTSITINGNGKLILMDNMVVNNDLTLMVNGTLEIYGSMILKNGARITVNGGGKVTTTGDINLQQNANFYVDGLATIGGNLNFGNNASFRGNGQVNISGTGCSNWSGPGTCNENIALPVELLSFDLEIVGTEVLIKWKTATEENNDYFTLERSNDGEKYEVIGTVEGNGTSVQENSYEYTDTNPIQGRAYYRLIQTDYDGKSETFKPSMIELESNQKFSFSVYPNPFEGSTLTVRFAQPTTGAITIMDKNGNQVYTGEIQEGNQETRLILNNAIPSGLYFVNVKSKAGSGVVKVLKK